MGVTIPPIGKMKEVGNLEVNQPVALGAGKKDNYVAIVTGVRGQLVNTSGVRGLDSGETILVNSWQWICRMQSLIENNIDKSSRWVIDNQFFTIIDFNLIDQKRFYYVFTLRSRQ